jgi:hypothetical protein
MTMGWEALNISNNMGTTNGIVIRAFGPTVSDGPIHSVQLGLRLGNSAFNKASQTGRAVVLVHGWFTPTNDITNIPNNKDWGSSSTFNPNGYNLGNGDNPPQGWGVNDAAGLMVFALTMECQLPAADLYRDQVFLPPGTIIPKGSWFSIRAVALTIPANIKLDFESQGVIFYG